MRRWSWALVLLLSCCGGSTIDDVDEETEMANGIAPWHMWGNTLSVSVPYSVAILNVASQQVVRLNYARPESFHFLFVAQLASFPEPVDTRQLRVFWDLTIGLGRSRSTLTNFETFIFNAPGPGNPTGQMKWSTEVVSPLRVDGVVTSGGITTSIVAEDITLGARLDFGGGAAPFPTDPAIVQLSAYFTPISHIRPEWYEGRFVAGEDQGK